MTPLPVGILQGGILPLNVGAAGITVLVPAVPANKIWVMNHVIRNPAGVFITLEDTTGAVLLTIGRVRAVGSSDIEVPAGRGLQIRLGSASAPAVTGFLHLVQG